MPFGLTRTINIPGSASAQTIVLPDVFSPDGGGLDPISMVETLKIPDVSALWINWYGDPAVIDGDDTVLAAEGSPYNSWWGFSNIKFREAQRPHFPDVHLSVIYAVTGFVQFTFW